MHNIALKLISRVLMIDKLQLKNIVKNDEHTVMRLHLKNIKVINDD